MEGSSRAVFGLVDHGGQMASKGECGRHVDWMWRSWLLGSECLRAAAVQIRR